MSPRSPPPFRSLAEEMSTTKREEGGPRRDYIDWTLCIMHVMMTPTSLHRSSKSCWRRRPPRARDEEEREKTTSKLQCWLRRFSTWYPSSIYSLVTHLASCGCFLEKIVTDSLKMRPLQLVAMEWSFIHLYHHLQKWLGASLLFLHATPCFRK